MTEERKFAPLFAAAILAARKLAELDRIPSDSAIDLGRDQ
jgi:hypothetical protein